MTDRLDIIAKIVKSRPRYRRVISPPAPVFLYRSVQEILRIDENQVDLELKEERRAVGEILGAKVGVRPL